MDVKMKKEYYSQSRHAWLVFLKFEKSFEICLSVLNIANEISEFPQKFP